jgi:cytochrome c biogenesis protein CcmG, thiol:disulfide interchange protein DsbE
VGDATTGDVDEGTGAIPPDPSRGPDVAIDTGTSGGEQAPTADRAAPGGRRRAWRVRSLLIGLVIVVALAVFLFVGLGSSSSDGPPVPIGSQAPGFSLQPLTGSVPVDLDTLGKDAHHPVILNFFASWCSPCQAETPLLAKAAAAEHAKGGAIRFIGVDVNDQPSNAVPFVTKSGITYPVGVDPDFRVTSGLYGLDGLPQTFFITSDGRVLGHTVGAVDAAELQTWMKKLSTGGR